jgi:hypothetical protein
MRRKETESEISERTAHLSGHVTHYLDVFEQVNKFTGPSLYFHNKTVQRLRTLGLPSVAIQDELFLDYLYATLTAWGLHRMGPKGAKLVSFDKFASSLKTHGSRLDKFCQSRIGSLTAVNVSVLTDSLWGVINDLSVSATESKIVAGSKTLHHLLPDLVPPIDREYTAEFFLWRNQMQYKQREMFLDVFPRLVALAKNIEGQIHSYIGRGFNTSLPKIVDNAIMGFMVAKTAQKS